MNRSGASECEQGEIPRIDSGRDDGALDQVGHVGLRNADNSGRRRDDVQAKFETQLSNRRLGSITLKNRTFVFVVQ